MASSRKRKSDPFMNLRQHPGFAQDVHDLGKEWKKKHGEIMSEQSFEECVWWIRERLLIKYSSSS
jgi:hypothetical protein